MIANTAYESMELVGLDGTNPLGFLAALGTLETARAAGEAEACLSWRQARTWVPVLECLSNADPAKLSETIAAALRGKVVHPDAERKREVAVKAFEAARTEVKKKKAEIKDRPLSRDEKRVAGEMEVQPLEEECDRRRREWLSSLRDAVPRPELALGARIDCTDEEYREHASVFIDRGDRISREPMDFLAAFGTDAVRGKNADAIEPTPFCFIRGASRQEFLDTVRQLIAHVGPELVRKALFETWTYCDLGLSMRWDPIEDRRYALMDRDPTAWDNKSRTVWMANLLAYRALPLFTSAPTGRSLGTTGWTLTDDERVFTWPIWEFSSSPDVIRSLLQLEDLSKSHPNRSALRARGISAVLRARRIKVGSGSNSRLNFSHSRTV